MLLTKNKNPLNNSISFPSTMKEPAHSMNQVSTLEGMAVRSLDLYSECIEARR
jgi:hypothetical protein